MKTKPFKIMLMTMAIFLGMNLIFSTQTKALPQYIVLCAPGINQGMMYNPETGTYSIECLQSTLNCFCIMLYLYGGNTCAPGQGGQPGVPCGCLDQYGAEEFYSWDYTTDKDGTTHYVFRQ